MYNTDIEITADDDGINAAAKSDLYDVTAEFNGGNITVIMAQGDTDGIDSNGIIIVNGGIIDVSGPSAFDYDISAVHNGGTVIVNGEETDEFKGKSTKTKKESSGCLSFA